MKKFIQILSQTFYKNFIFTASARSIQKKYNIMTLTLFNCVFIFLVLHYEFLISNFETSYNNSILSFSCFIFIGSSLLLLRRGFDRLATICTIFYIHTTVYVGAIHQGSSLIAIIAISMIPGYCMLLGLSNKLTMLNTLICLTHYAICVPEIWKIFYMLLTKEQSDQFNMLLVFAPVFLIINTFVVGVRMWIEENLFDSIDNSFNNSENLTKELIKIIAARDTFVSSLSHCMNDSISCISRDINQLIETSQDDRQFELIETVRLSIETFENTVKNLLDVCELKPNIQSPSDRPKEFREIINGVLDTYSRIISQRNTSVKVLIDKKLPARFNFHSSRMTQVINNIVSNAVKYTQDSSKITISAIWRSNNETKEHLLRPIDMEFLTRSRQSRIQDAQNSSRAGLLNGEDSLVIAGPPNEIADEQSQQEISFTYRKYSRHKTVNCRGLERLIRSSEMKSRPRPWNIQYIKAPLPDPPADPPQTEESKGLSIRGYVQVQVTDNGLGIVPQKFAHIFDSESAREGVTTGLWLCKKLCEKMNGDIQAYSQPNHGATLIFYIPVYNTEGAGTQVPDIVANTHSVPRPIGKVTCLVVDDHPFNRDLHKLLLEKEGVDVKIASNGREAFEVYIRHGGEYFDFILMDIRMPVMTGFQSAREIRTWERQKNKKRVEICFVSAGCFTEGEMLAEVKGGGNENNVGEIKNLPKPIDLELLRRYITKYRDRVASSL